MPEHAQPGIFFPVKDSSQHTELSSKGKEPRVAKDATHLAKKAMKTVLIIDDNHDYREVFREILEEHDVEVFESDCPDSAYELLHTIDPPDLIVCDVHMPFTMKAGAGEFVESAEVGIRTAQELAWVYPNTHVIALTATDAAEMATIKNDLAPIPAYQKPVGYKDLLELVHCFLACNDFGGLQ